MDPHELYVNLTNILRNVSYQINFKIYILFRVNYSNLLIILVKSLS